MHKDKTMKKNRKQSTSNSGYVVKEAGTVWRGTKDPDNVLFSGVGSSPAKYSSLPSSKQAVS